MKYIKQFNFIEQIATKGLDHFYEENYSEDFVLSQFREGVSIEVVWLKQINSSWEITKENKYNNKQLSEITWQFDTKGEVTIPDEESIEKFLRENQKLSETAFDWKAFRYSKPLKEVYYEIHIRHFSQNPLELGTQKKFEAFYQLYFDYHFKNLRDYLIRVVKQEYNEYSDYEENETLDFYDILLYENKIEQIFNQFYSIPPEQYKEKTYKDLLKRLSNLFLYLKKEFPILYNELTTKYPKELKNIHKLQWYPLKDIFFLLFSELNKAGFLRNHKNREAKYYELTKILMQNFEILPKTGQNYEYTPQTFEKRLQNPVSGHNEERLETVKRIIKELVKEINQLDKF